MQDKYETKSKLATHVENNLKGKTLIPFCSHGSGRFVQTLTAVIKLIPDAEIDKL